MDRKVFYRWMDEIGKWRPELGKWQGLGLALFSLGVVLAETCQVTRVAEHLGEWGKPDSVERRLQRWLSNPKIEVQTCCRCWVRWVWARYGSQVHVVLVDETNLHQHLGVMMLGLAYEGRSIPLVWRCYVANRKSEYPVEG